MAENDLNNLECTAITQSSRGKFTQTQPLAMTYDQLMSQSGETSPTKVYVLDLQGCHFTDIENISKFTHIRSLDLSCNKLTTVSGSMFSNNTFLCELKLYSNAINTIRDMNKVKKLVRLSLQMNQITNIGDTFCNLSKLEILRLDFNLLTKLDTAKQLVGCNSLVVLNLAHNKLVTVKELNLLKQLQKLDLSHNNLESVDFLINCTSLTELDISHNTLKGDVRLTNLKQIQNLNLANNEIKTLSFTKDVNFKSLQDLDLSNNQFIAIPQDISLTCPNMEYLSICDNLITSLDGIQEAIAHLSHISVCLLDGNPLLNEYNPIEIREKLKESCSNLLTIEKTNIPSIEKLPFEIEIETNFKEIDDVIENYDFLIKSTIESLQSKINMSETNATHQCEDGRPPSRSHSRARLQEALNFASKTFSEENLN